jgi:hypothetical protein
VIADASQERRLRGFRMPLYPPLSFLRLVDSSSFFSLGRIFLKEMRTAGLILIAGAVVYAVHYFTAGDRSAES